MIDERMVVEFPSKTFYGLDDTQTNNIIYLIRYQNIDSANTKNHNKKPEKVNVFTDIQPDIYLIQQKNLRISSLKNNLGLKSDTKFRY